MRAVVAHTIKSVREVNTKFGPRCVAEVEFVGERGVEGRGASIACGASLSNERLELECSE